MYKFISLYFLFTLTSIGELHPKVLDVLEEKAIESYEGDEVYRFSWIRNRERPIVIRIALKDESQGRIVIKETDGVGGYGLDNYGKVILHEERDLSPMEVKAFRNVLAENNFWNAKYIFDPPPDGSYWRIEAYDGVHSHILERFTPDEGVVYNIGLHFIMLTKLPVKEFYLKKIEEEKQQKLWFVIYSVLGLAFVVGLCIVLKRSRNLKSI